jgi:hypothetical protein
MGKKRCRDCTRKELELAERRLVESWLCLFFDDVFCPFSKVAKDKRLSSVCLDCEHYARSMLEMAEEDERVMDEIDEMRKNPEKYGYGKEGDFTGFG